MLRHILVILFLAGTAFAISSRSFLSAHEELRIAESNYRLEYFHTFGANDHVVLSNGHLVTAKKNTANTRFFIKSHVIGDSSEYETLREVSTGKWVKATQEGTSLVNTEDEATKFLVWAYGPRYIIYLYDAQNPK